MRALVLSVILAFASVPATAETLSQEIGRSGLQATEARLATLASPTNEDLFALAGLRFLGGVEAALQLRWQTGIRADWSELPILRLPIPENPAARAFQPSDFTTLVTDLDARMDSARAALDLLGERPFALDIALADLWFDINMNGTRDPGEEVAAVAGLLGGGRIVAVPVENPVITFDTADAAWLSAYTHFLSGFAATALAYDPEPAIQRVMDSSAAIYALWGDTPPPNAMDMMFGRQVDRIAMVLFALSNTPDKALALKAHGHFLSMIEDNRRFWSLVALEPDNAGEWVPNDRQVSALGIMMPPGTGERWQAVLADAEALLQGKALIPHWRFGAEAGINLKKLFENPPPLDLVTLIQGEGMLPYAEKGPRVSPMAWNEFQRLVQGDAMLFAVFLN
ncbi:hypothetical protein EI545_07010 [Tabrizicola piscis]|uniref:Uncharacterized protein n=1 Tax=Tabrizicola piscis TaxID=2494374 RepID=A0A3S8U4R5_9RHOB|nr:hypothetical protein [Tabrizicola piscis]AZL58606.1 hypothetical protein EI545_07010 [Tabrizicola piscis]